jgi:hypothetical protein
MQKSPALQPFVRSKVFYGTVNQFAIFQGNTVYWGGPNEADLSNVVLISDIPITEGLADQGYRGNLSETLKNQLVIICHHSAKEYWRAS